MCVKARSGRPENGFTLIEVLVVLVISVGLVVTMALLFRAVGQTTLILRGGNDEWTLQTRLREQLRHLLTLPGEPALAAGPAEVIFTTWKSQRDNHDGKPVIAQYRYEADQRTVYYRESDMPAWWPQAAKFTEMRQQLAQASETRLASGIDDLQFRFLAPEASELSPASLQMQWQKAELPRILQLNFSRAGRPYNLYLETRGLAAQTANR